MDKKVIAKFPTGEVFEIDAQYVAACIAHKLLPNGTLDEHTKIVNEVLEDEFIIFDHIWDFPWSDLKEHAVMISTPELEETWNGGGATVSVNW